MSLYSRASTASSLRSLGSPSPRPISRAASPSHTDASSLISNDTLEQAPPPALHNPFQQPNRSSSTTQSSHSLEASHSSMYGLANDSLESIDPASALSSRHNSIYHSDYDPDRFQMQDAPQNVRVTHPDPQLRDHHEVQMDGVPSDAGSAQREPVIHAPQPVRPIHTNHNWERRMEMAEYITLRTKVSKMIDALHSHADSHGSRKPPFFAGRERRDSHAGETEQLRVLLEEYHKYWIVQFPDPQKTQGFTPSAAQIAKLTLAVEELFNALPPDWDIPQPQRSATLKLRGRSISISNLLERVKSRSKSRGANELGAGHWEGAHEGWGTMSARTAARYGL